MFYPHAREMNPPLRAGQYNEPGQVAMGYGIGGGDPITLSCDADEDSDTGFFKLFVSDVNVDMGHIAQKAAIEATSKRKASTKADKQNIWDCSLAVVTVTQPSEVT